MAVSDLHSSPGKPPAASKIPVWLWPHVLSLEAPIVAVLWALALGRLHEAPWLPGVLPGLALCVWTIYLVDRTIDTFGVDPEKLDARHQVYRRFRPLLLGVVLPACAAGLVWLGLWVIPQGLMWQSVTLAMLVLLYLAAYSAATRRLLYTGLVVAVGLVAILLLMMMPLPMAFKLTVSVILAGLLSLLVRERTRQRLLVTVPKEIAGGLLFALGCTAWVRFDGTGGGYLGWVETVLLTVLFTCNLTGITAAETEAAKPQAPIEHGHHGLLTGLALLSAGAILAAHLRYVPERFELLGWATGAGAVLLTFLHARRRHLSLDAYRVLADLAVAAPAVALFMVTGTGSRSVACCLP
ncbi:MAG: hypothetical protein U0984_00085 [Prosthecobacter sp.]|nr:hypothetical protein [Prosthecobacter sp.]